MKSKVPRKSKKSKQGQAIVEFMLVLIPFLMMLMGIMQIAHIAVTALLVNHAAFSVARVGSVTDSKNMMRKAAQKALPFRDADVSVEVLSKNDDPELEIKVTYNMPLVFPIVNTVIKNARGLGSYRLPIEAQYMLPKETIVYER